MKNRLQILKNKKIIAGLAVSFVLIVGCIGIALAASNNANKKSSGSKQESGTLVAAKDEGKSDSGKKKDTFLSQNDKETKTEENAGTVPENETLGETKSSQGSAEALGSGTVQESSGTSDNGSGQENSQTPSGGMVQESTGTSGNGTVQENSQTPSSGMAQESVGTSGNGTVQENSQTPSSGTAQESGGTPSSTPSCCLAH